MDELRQKAVAHAEARGFVRGRSEDLWRGREQITVLGVDRVARQLGFVVLDLMLQMRGNATWKMDPEHRPRRPSDPVA